VHVKYHNIHVIVQNTIALTSNISARSNAMIAVKERKPYSTLVFLRTSGWSGTESTDIVVKRAHTKREIAIPIIPPYSSNGERDVAVTSFSDKNPVKQINKSIKNSNLNSSFIILCFFVYVSFV